MPGPMDRGWMDQDCPSRGAALSHAHWASCNPTAGGHPGSGAKHSWATCCHCEMTAEESRAEQAAVDARLAAVGLLPPGPMDDMLIEPKTITGKGPQGPVRGQEKQGDPAHGRLPFSIEDQKRLHFFVGLVREPAVVEGNAFLHGDLKVDTALLEE